MFTIVEGLMVGKVIVSHRRVALSQGVGNDEQVTKSERFATKASYGIKSAGCDGLCFNASRNDRFQAFGALHRGSCGSNIFFRSMVTR